MTAGDILRSGLRTASGLLCLSLCVPLCAQQSNPLRPGLHLVSDSVAPWAYQAPPRAEAPLLSPPDAPPEPPLSPQPILPPAAQPFEPPQSWPDEPATYDPEIHRGLRGKFHHWRESLETWFGIGFDHNERYIGLGDPLTNTSWLNRPWSFGTFFGSRFNDQPLAGVLAQSNSTVMGLRLGFDVDYYWGLEGRFSFSNPDMFEPGVPNARFDSHNYYVDVSAMYYPWGDSRWRPYFSAGLGAATYRFTNNAAINVADSALYVPLGFGLKYFQSPWFTLRLDAAYELSLGTNMLDTQNSFTIAAAAEFRFGGRRKSYFPWDGGTILW